MTARDDERRSTVNDDMLRKVQLALLEIAKEIKRVCDENGIDYFLDSGSLLGAVRHKGFIPWDDDMDFGMLREDYDRFLKIAPEKLRPEFRLQTWDDDPFFPMPFCKVCKRGTLFLEPVAQFSQARKELFVDVFPYNNYPDARFARARVKFGCKFLRDLLNLKCGYATWASRKGLDRLWRRAKTLPLRVLSLFVSKRFLISRFTALATRSSAAPTARLCAQTSAYGKWVVPASCLVGRVDLPFEDDVFKAPAGYDAYLSSVYGDYMTLPPENKRKSHGALQCRLEVEEGCAE